MCRILGSEILREENSDDWIQRYLTEFTAKIGTDDNSQPEEGKVCFRYQAYCITSSKPQPNNPHRRNLEALSVLFWTSGWVNG